MSVSLAVFERSQNVVWSFVFFLAVLLALGGCGGGSSDRERAPDPTPDPDILSLSAPVIDGALIAGMSREWQLDYTYDPAAVGDELVELRFSLPEAPSGMTVLEDTGTLLWTPSPALEGTEHTVRARAELGDETAEVTFSVSVALSTPVASSVVGNTVAVTQPGSLQGFAITVPEEATRPAGQIQVRVVDEAQAPQLPEGVVRLSDFFVVSPVTTDTGAIIVSLPAALVPSGMRVEHLSLFTYEEAFEFGVWDPDVDTGPTDSASWATTGSDFEIMADAVSFEVSALGALSFIGYYSDTDGATWLESASNLEGSLPTALEPFSNGNRCQRRVLPDGASESEGIWDCEADGFRLQIKRHAPTNWGGGLTADDIFGWAIEARAKIQGLNMDADNQLTVSIEPLAGALGLWKPSTPKTLYIRNELPSMLELTRAEVAKHVLAHEFFHHTQFRTRIDDRNNMIVYWVSGGVPKARIMWALEGTAVWFEDEVYDAANLYRRLVPDAGLPAFLTRNQQRGLGLTSANIEWYQYFAWWKLLSNRCSGFSVRDMLNMADGGQWGVRNLAEKVNSPAWNCGFTAGFEDTTLGPERRFASALLHYAYATHPETGQRENSLGLLDSNEPDVVKFEGAPTSWWLTPSAECKTIGSDWRDTCPEYAWRIGEVGVAAANVVDVEWLPELPEDSGADTRTAIFHFVNLGDSDLYAFLVQQAGAEGSWPTGRGIRIPPGQPLKVSPSSFPELRTPYNGDWSVFLINPSVENRIVYALITGIEEEEELIAGRYEVIGADGGIVRDVVTGLEWQRCPVGQTWNPSENRCDGPVLGPTVYFDWYAAMELTASGGFRLPSLQELQTLVYCAGEEQAYFNESGEFCAGTPDVDFARPTIVLEAFPNAPRTVFWTASEDTEVWNPDVQPEPTRAWLVNFNLGNSRAANKDLDFGNWVRLVRGGL